ncbi:sigma-70 family RNA polymerase sigma factor [Weizmannia sp. FSL K6-0777]|uniref:sigma-70 family RNA polymerase sigma factor n=1 Tax=Heyndrickxia TaxID=2837504 RepID=UPI0023E3B110|nr:sigma-70 family RNA polymerase sigma factor [Heyndrickxia coagulans]
MTIAGSLSSFEPVILQSTREFKESALSKRGSKVENFEEVLRQYRPMIFHMIRKLRIYKNIDEFEQIGMIALWEAYQNRQDDKGSFTSYAYNTIRGKMLTELTKRRREEKMFAFPKEEFWNVKVDESLRPPLELETLLSYCDGLTEKEKKWVVATFYEQLKQGEIAFREGKSVEAVKKWRRQALEKIRKSMEQKERKH